MKNVFQNSPYALTALTFLALLAAGHVFWGWGALTSAFCLLLYCVVAVGIKLDDIAGRLDRLTEQVQRASVAPAGGAPAERPLNYAPADNGSADAPADH